MTAEIDTLQGIVDIIPPLAPVTPQWQSLLIIVSLVLLLFVLIYYLSLRHNSARGKALRKLNKIQHALHQVHTEKLTVPTQLATVLRQGLRLQQLTTYTALPINLINYQDRWKLFIRHLTEACYDKKNLHVEELDKLVNDAKFWLRCWP